MILKYGHNPAFSIRFLSRYDWATLRIWRYFLKYWFRSFKFCIQRLQDLIKLCCWCWPFLLKTCFQIHLRLTSLQFVLCAWTTFSHFNQDSCECEEFIRIRCLSCLLEVQNCSLKYPCLSVLFCSKNRLNSVSFLHSFPQDYYIG